MGSRTNERYQVYLIEDPEDHSDEIRDFINVLCQEFDCFGNHPRCKIYIPSRDDLAGEYKLTSFFQGRGKCDRVLCIISRWNTNWVKYCQKSAVYKSIMEGNREKFVPVFLGYSSVEEALRDCPEEIEEQTKVIFNRQWREDVNSWQKLRRSLNLQEVPIITATDESCRPVQCSEDFRGRLELDTPAVLEESPHELCIDGPLYSMCDDSVGVSGNDNENVSCQRTRALARTTNQRTPSQGFSPILSSNAMRVRPSHCGRAGLVASNQDASSGCRHAANAGLSHWRIGVRFQNKV